ncbi:MAG TPA: ABC transporter C-terminal domain-containing protein, partial [Acidimicrobiales bacterium]|nr:ABC transporter C-terminal domain-containing protein [Acidimicrobiales bacterium]
EVRDGRAILHEGVPDRVLYPAQVLAKPRPKPDPARSGLKTEKPPRRRDPNQALRRRLKRAEKAWEEAETVVLATQAVLADPGLYSDPSTDHAAVREAVAAHDAACDRAADLMAEWETLNARLGG